MAEYAVYDTVWIRYVGGTSTDQAAQQTIADALTADTGRAHTVVQVEEDDAPDATETAYFVATGSDVTDEANHAAAVIVDPAHGALPSWISVEGNVITVNRFVQLLGGAAGAFTANFPTTLPGGGDGFVALFCDAQITVPDGSPVTWFGTDYYSTDEATEDLDVETNPNLGTAQNFPPGTTITFFTQGGAYESDGTTPVTDGTYEGTAYFAFQAQMFAPVLPEA